MVAKTALIGRKRDCEVTAGYRAKAKKNPPSEENQNLSLSLSLSLSLYTSSSKPTASRFIRPAKRRNYVVTSPGT